MWSEKDWYFLVVGTGLAGPGELGREAFWKRSIMMLAATKV
jgi:hypothetical protein